MSTVCSSARYDTMVGKAKCANELLDSPTTGVPLIFSGRDNKKTCQNESGSIYMSVARYGANSTSEGKHLSRWKKKLKESTNERNKNL